MKVYILKFLRLYRQKLESVDDYFWDNLYTVDVEEVDVLNV